LECNFIRHRRLTERSLNSWCSREIKSSAFSKIIVWDPKVHLIGVKCHKAPQVNKKEPQLVVFAGDQSIKSSVFSNAARRSMERILNSWCSREIKSSAFSNAARRSMERSLNLWCSRDIKSNDVSATRQHSSYSGWGKCDSALDAHGRNDYVICRRSPSTTA
jgi:hypothetical protein